MPHQFAKCEDTHGQRVHCIRCGTSRLLADMYADLNGAAFKAYYCAPCRHMKYEDNDGTL